MIPIIALVIAGLAAGFSAYATIQQGEIQSDTLKYNSEMQRRAAEEKVEAAASDAWKQMKLDEAEMAANRVYFASSGVRIDDGSPALSLVTQAGYRGMNVAAIRQRGMSEASQLFASSQLSQFSSGAAKTSSYWQAGTTLLTGASQMMNAYSAANYSKNILSKRLGGINAH